MNIAASVESSEATKKSLKMPIIFSVFVALMVFVMTVIYTSLNKQEQIIRSILADYNSQMILLDKQKNDLIAQANDLTKTLASEKARYQKISGSTYIPRPVVTPLPVEQPPSIIETPPPEVVVTPPPRKTRAS